MKQLQFAFPEETGVLPPQIASQPILANTIRECLNQWMGALMTRSSREVIRAQLNDILRDIASQGMIVYPIGIGDIDVNADEGSFIVTFEYNHQEPSL